jgi:hypothetical protein
VTVDEPALAEHSPDDATSSAATTPGRESRSRRRSTRHTEARTAQQQAIDTYKARIRTRRWVYAVCLVVIVGAALVGVKIAYSRGEISHVTLRTIATPPASVPVQSPAASVRPAWNTSDRTALGQPNWGGTLVTVDDHSVRGRNAITGQVTWSYTRTDRPLCDAVQDFGTTIAFYVLHGDCDEVTALDSETGKRKWTRTLDKDDTSFPTLTDDTLKGRQHVIGHPTFAISQFSLLVITPAVIYNLDPVGGLDRWTFSQKGCTIRGAVFGSQGALISQNCTSIDCNDRKFCGKGPQLLLRNGTDARGDESKNKTNPDQVIWNRIGLDAVPVSADQVISATDQTASELTVFVAKRGTTVASLPLQGATSAGAVAQVNTATAELVWVGGVTYAVQTSGTDFLWKAESAGAPTVTPLPGSLTTPPDLGQSSVFVPAADGVDSLDPQTGTVKQHYSVPSPGTGSRVYPLASGFVVAGSATALYR